MRIELTRVGLLVYLANHYTTRGALLRQQCPACLVRLIWVILAMGGRWPYSHCFLRCCFPDLFNIDRSILMQFPSILVSVHVVHPYSTIEKTTGERKLRFIWPDKFDSHMIDNLSIAVHAFACNKASILLSLLTDKTQ